MMPLRTERLILRNWRESDRELFHLINSDPQGNGWFFTMKLSDPSELDGLMDETAYKAYCDTL